MRISDWSSDVCSSDLGPEQSKGGQVVPTPGILHDQIFSVIIVELVQLEICFMRQIPLQNVDENALAVPMHGRSEEHTSELQSLMRISYAVFCLKKKNKQLQVRLKQSYKMYT